MAVHQFTKSLKRAENEKFLPFWLDVYNEMWPNAGNISGTIGNIPLQKKGIDRIITLENGRNLYVDEKVRFRNYNDILLEYWSSYEHRTPGWMDKNLDIDYLCYAFVNDKLCYVIPWHNLKRVWRYYREKWIRSGEQQAEGFKTVRAENEGYTTISVAVPTNLLMGKVMNSCRIEVR